MDVAADVEFAAVLDVADVVAAVAVDLYWYNIQNFVIMSYSSQAVAAAVDVVVDNCYCQKFVFSMLSIEHIHYDYCWSVVPAAVEANNFDYFASVVAAVVDDDACTDHFYSDNNHRCAPDFLDDVSARRDY